VFIPITLGDIWEDLDRAPPQKNENASNGSKIR